MTKEITSALAMSHPTVVATINVLAEMNQRLQDENDELKAASAQTEQELMKQRELIKELADQYTTEFAKAIASGANSMSPIAVKAGDIRLALHAAIDALTAAPMPEFRHRNSSPEQEPVGSVRWGGDEVVWTGEPPESGALLYTTPPKRERAVFPTMLRKMWSGSEVQAWLDENVNKEKNT